MRKHGIDAILNVAHDLQCQRGWTDGIVYAQCGLQDGPGNTMAAYHAAVLTLCDLLLRNKSVMVCDHDAGSRAIAVIIMAMHAMRRMGWEHWHKVIAEKIALGAFECEGIPTVHVEHRRAFNRINWRLLSSVFEG